MLLIRMRFKIRNVCSLGGKTEYIQTPDMIFSWFIRPFVKILPPPAGKRSWPPPCPPSPYPPTPHPPLPPCPSTTCPPTPPQFNSISHFYLYVSTRRKQKLKSPRRVIFV